MMPLIENGVAVHFPDANYFQLSDCNAYKVLTPDAVKEMDIWLDKGSDTLWMVELKAFHHPENPRFWPQDISNNEIFEYWLNELFIKSVHTLCMMETDRSGTKQCLVDGIKPTTVYKLVHLINVAPGQEEYLTFMKDKLNALLRPYIRMFNVNTVTVLTYATAKTEKWLPWIV